MERIQHDLVQGSPEWLQFRLEHNGSSEAAAMIGLSKKTLRNELLRVKHTGIGKEFSDWVQENILDHGHAVEAMARPLVEEIIGEELYPQTWSYGRKSASTDGLTMTGKLAFEHKQWNKALAAAVARGELPDEFQPQCQQIMDVTGAERVIFVVSDGTRENFVHMYVDPDPEWVKRIDAGWDQFDDDLLTYKPPEVTRQVVATPTKALPTLAISVKGKVSLVDNLEAFGIELKTFLKQIPEKPETDQQFVDCKAAIASLKTAEEALRAEEERAMGQIASFAAMKKTVDLYFELSRTARLALEKLVEAQEKKVKEDAVLEGKIAITEHITTLNKRLGLKPNGTGHMPIIPVDFVAAIKNKRTVASLKNAVDTELARAKIAANAVAEAIQINLNSLRDMAGEYKELFADTPQLIMKSNEDLVTLITLRITQHKETLRKRDEEQRARLEQEARDKLAAEQTADNERAARERQIAATSAPVPVPVVQSAPAPVPVVESAARGAPTAGVSTTVPAANTGGSAGGSGIGRLQALITVGMLGMTPGELQQVLDFIRTVVSAREQRRTA